MNENTLGRSCAWNGGTHTSLFATSKNGGGARITICESVDCRLSGLGLHSLSLKVFLKVRKSQMEESETCLTLHFGWLFLRWWLHFICAASQTRPHRLAAVCDFLRALCALLSPTTWQGARNWNHLFSILLTGGWCQGDGFWEALTELSPHEGFKHLKPSGLESISHPSLIPVIPTVSPPCPCLLLATGERCCVFPAPLNPRGPKLVINKSGWEKIGRTKIAQTFPLHFEDSAQFFHSLHHRFLFNVTFSGV